MSVEMREVFAQLLQEDDATFVLRRAVPYSEADFWRLADAVPEFQFERTPEGEIIVMSPVNPLGSEQEGIVFGELYNWNRQMKLGTVYPSSVAIRLLSGALRSPDACWISYKTYDPRVSNTDAKALVRCPEFVVEIRSASNRLNELQQKMQEYISAGAVVGWLIDPIRGTWQRFSAAGAGPEIVLVLGLVLTEPELLPGFALLADPFLV